MAFVYSDLTRPPPPTLSTLGVRFGAHTVEGGPLGLRLRPGAGRRHARGAAGPRPLALAQASLVRNFLRYRPGHSRHVPAAESATVRSAAEVKPRDELPPRIRAQARPLPRPNPRRRRRPRCAPRCASANSPPAGLSSAALAYQDLESAANRDREDQAVSVKQLGRRRRLGLD